MNDALSGKVALVTGGRSGIGATCVRLLLASGCKVAALDVSDPGAHDGSLSLVADVTDTEAVEHAVGTTHERLGEIELLVQCAGITRDRMLWRLSDDEWQDVIDVNLGGAFRVLRAVVPGMRRLGRGSIVNVASINGLRGKLGQANYAASKAGLVALTKTAARELGGFGIRVNAVAPGLVQTPMTANLTPQVIQQARDEAVLEGATEPEDVAAVVLFLLSDAARRITGSTLRVDAGQYM